MLFLLRVTSENSEAAAAPERSRVKRSGTKRRKPGIKLTVLSVSSENQSMTVECQLDTSKQKTVVFKFDRDDMVPADIANNLVSANFLLHNFFFSVIHRNINTVGSFTGDAINIRVVGF